MTGSFSGSFADKKHVVHGCSTINPDYTPSCPISSTSYGGRVEWVSMAVHAMGGTIATSKMPSDRHLAMVRTDTEAVSEDASYVLIVDNERVGNMRACREM
ncbi:hypothetical protein TNCV_2104761 [Trichonephila clavipes]|nr:hypothetical protein TNCV_2104761 [Trichonephila clavipes]